MTYFDKPEAVSRMRQGAYTVSAHEPLTCWYMLNDGRLAITELGSSGYVNEGVEEFAAYVRAFKALPLDHFYEIDPADWKPLKTQEVGFTYLIWAYSNELAQDADLKIGKSRHPYKRLKELSTGNASRLRLLAVLPGDREGELHSTFAHCRAEGEWFRVRRDSEEMEALYETFRGHEVTGGDGYGFLQVLANRSQEECADSSHPPHPRVLSLMTRHNMKEAA